MRVIFLLLLIPLQVSAGDFTRTTPEGAVYDVRTHRYKNGKVSLRAGLEGLRGEDKREVYAMLGLTINVGSPKWLAAQARWQSELDRRHSLRVEIAQEYAQKRRERIQRPPVIHYWWYSYPTGWNYPPRWPYPNYFSYWGIHQY